MYLKLCIFTYFHNFNRPICVCWYLLTIFFFYLGSHTKKLKGVSRLCLNLVGLHLSTSPSCLTNVIIEFEFNIMSHLINSEILSPTLTCLKMSRLEYLLALIPDLTWVKSLVLWGKNASPSKWKRSVSHLDALEEGVSQSGRFLIALQKAKPTKIQVSDSMCTSYFTLHVLAIKRKY